MKNVNNDFEKVVKFFKSLGVFGILIVLGIYILTGIYIVGPDEEGIVLTFGKKRSKTTPGMHWAFPSPISKVIKIKTTKAYRIEMGFETIKVGKYIDKTEEATMLTGDENILIVNSIVQYNIKNIEQYAFNLKNPQPMIKDAAEAALREVVGKSKNIDEVLTTGKEKLQIETKDKLQYLLDKYESGVVVKYFQLQDVQPPKEVMNAFKDVSSAKEDKERYINEAVGYMNDIIPKAKGEAEKIINESSAYKEKRIKEAEGDVARFEKLYERYKLGKEVTKVRLYLETMERIMPNLDKVIVDKELENGILNVLNPETKKEGGLK